jgi:hypothetical protein
MVQNPITELEALEDILKSIKKWFAFLHKKDIIKV